MCETDRPDFRSKRAGKKVIPGARTARVVVLSLLLMFASVIATGFTANVQSAGSALSVRGPDGKFRVWWRSSQAPSEWKTATPAITEAIQWRKVRPGLESSTLEISGEGVGWRVQIVLVRFLLDLFSLQLDSAVVDSKPAWCIDSASPRSVLAMNAGQFEGSLPWGWIVQDGREVQPPRTGPLSSALVVDSEGHGAIADAAEIPGVRENRKIILAFQSYPAILVGDGRVPEAFFAPGRGVDLDHRDSRLALGSLRDGRFLIALTRFGPANSPLARLPFGPTSPEMAAIMGALGCRRAMLLDGGISGQLSFRDMNGRLTRWPGFRLVPLGLVGFPKRP